MNKRLTAMAFSVLAGLSTLQQVSATDNNSGQVRMISFKVGDTGVMVQVAPDRLMVDNARCTGVTTTSTAALSSYHPRFNELYAAIMLAHASSRDVAFWLDGCDSKVPGGPHPSIVMVYVF